MCKIIPIDGIKDVKSNPTVNTKSATNKDNGATKINDQHSVIMKMWMLRREGTYLQGGLYISCLYRMNEIIGAADILFHKFKLMPYQSIVIFIMSDS